MPRWTVAFAVIPALTAAPIAQACGCVGHPTPTAVEAAGERAYAAADLIVDATPAGTPDAYRRICFGPGNLPRPRDYGRKIAMDRPFVIHRVLKGRAPLRPILAAEPAEVTRHGCGILSNSCQVEAPESGRHILILRKVAAGRYKPLSVCEHLALRNSRRGQALFNRDG